MKYSSTIISSAHETYDRRDNTVRQVPEPALRDDACHGTCHWTAPIGLVAVRIDEHKKSHRRITIKSQKAAWNG